MMRPPLEVRYRTTQGAHRWFRTPEHSTRSAIVDQNANMRGAFVEQTDETVSLISAGKVQGTHVYDTQGDNLGEVYDVMIDKRSGKIAYAVMSFGGFLGVGNSYHPLPWNTLKYDTRQGGYVVGLTREQLEGAPSFARGETPAWGDRGYEEGIHAYYKAAPYWA
jgi:hypothetical protein